MDTETCRYDIQKRMCNYCVMTHKGKMVLDFKHRNCKELTKGLLSRPGIFSKISRMPEL